MEFPSTVDFLEAFGIEPVEEDPSMATTVTSGNQWMGYMNWISPSAQLLRLSR